MKHLDEYRDAETAHRLAASIQREAATGRRYRLMEFCGGHTHAIFRYGLEDLLPANIEMVHGPGCPVCVLPTGRLDMAIRLASRDGVILASYGDMLRVPGSKGQSLMKAKADGADIRMVYSTPRRGDARRSQSGPRSDLLRHRLRDHHAADRAGDRGRRQEGTHELLGVLQSRADAVGDRGHPRGAGGARTRHRRDRRLPRARRMSRSSSAASPMSSSPRNTASRWRSPASSRSISCNRS